MTRTRCRRHSSCVYCTRTMTDVAISGKILRRGIPAAILLEDEHLIAFRDIAPQAPVHVLFVPKTPIPRLDDLKPEQAAVVGRLVVAAAAYARREGLAGDGCAGVMHCNDPGGPTG